MRKYTIALFFVLGFSLSLFSPSYSEARTSVSINLGFPSPVYAYQEPVYVPVTPVYVVREPRYRRRHHPRWDRERYYNDGIYFNYSSSPRRGHGHGHHRGGWSH